MKKKTLTLNQSERELLKKLLAEHNNALLYQAKRVKIDIRLTNKSFDPHGYKKLNIKLCKLNKKLDKVSALINSVKHRNE